MTEATPSSPPAAMPRYARQAMNILMQHDGDGWKLLGILPASDAGSEGRRRELVRDDGVTQIYRWEGLVLRLLPDACDDYWFNLTSDQPRLYVICQADDQGVPVPMRITADQDDAVAAEEVDEWFFQAEMPTSVVFWIRDYVATHWRPGPRKEKIKGKQGDKYRQGDGQQRS